MGVAVLESKFRELTASHEKLVESLDKATKAAVAPRSKLDAGLTDLSKRVETLKLAVAKAAEEQVKVKEEGAATGKELSSLKAQVTDADKARLGANAAREKAVDAALEAIRAKLAKAEKGVAALSGKDTAAQAAAAKEEVLKAAGVAIAAKMEAHAKTLHQAGNATTQQVMDAVEERLKALVAEELGMQVDRAVGAQVGKALADKKSGAPAGSQWFGSGGASDSAQLEKVVRGVLGRLYKERIGQVDWLLQINGASVVASSPSLALCSATDALCRLRNIVSLQTDPTTFLRIESSATWWWSDSSGSMLGNCWAMAGAEGFVHVALAQKMEPKVFVLQHAPSSISADNATSAPLKFRVRGYEGATAAAGEEGVVLVEGEYNPHAKGKGELMSHLQTFAVTKRAEVRSVRLEVLSNHGKEAFTCLYHMRMHGDAKEAAGAK